MFLLPFESYMLNKCLPLVGLNPFLQVMFLLLTTTATSWQVTIQKSVLIPFYRSCSYYVAGSDCTVNVGDDSSLNPFLQVMFLLRTRRVRACQFWQRLVLIPFYRSCSYYEKEVRPCQKLAYGVLIPFYRSCSYYRRSSDRESKYPTCTVLIPFYRSCSYYTSTGLHERRRKKRTS